MTRNNPYAGNGGYKGQEGYNRYGKVGNTKPKTETSSTTTSKTTSRPSAPSRAGQARPTVERQPRKTVKKRKTRNSGNGGKRKMRLWLKILLLLIAIGVVCCLAVGVYVLTVIADMPDWDSNALFHESSSILYDNEGTEFQTLHAGQNRTPVDLESMPQYLIDCTLASEDARFYKHHGIDVIRIGGALIADIKAGSAAQGASTITMQLARNAVLEDQAKKLERKIKEAVVAIQLEKHYEKDEILEMYLNEIYFGHGVYGAQMAAQKYFGKDVEDLTLAESAMLIAVIRTPGKYSPYIDMEKAITVRNRVLDALADYKPEYKEEAEAAKAEEIVLNDTVGSKALDSPYGWFTDYVIEEGEEILESLGIDPYAIYTGGYHIYTTLNNTVQELMNESYANPDNFPSSNSADPVQSAMVVMDVKNGAVLGMIGGREYTTQRGYNRAYDMTRQPGSAYKPIGVFSPAIEAGLSPASVMNDVLTTFGADYSPKNYDYSESGVISMREAARVSKNIPAVKFLQSIGIDNSLAMAGKLGINLNSNQDGNLSMALGGLTYGVSPLQMAAAYSAFANEGIYSQPYCIEKILDRNGNEIYKNTPVQHEAMSETTAYLVTDMLQTVTTSGTGTTAQLSNRSVASKTGTVQLPDTAAFKNVKGNKDAWFAAYTPEMVGIVWMGYDEDIDSNGNPQYLKQIYGGKYPAQIWKKVIGGASKNLPASTFTRPEGIVTAQVDAKSGLLPSELTPAEYIVSELFAEGTVPTEVSTCWQYVNVCTDTNYIAGEYCLNTKSELRFIAPEEPAGNVITTEKGPEDAALQISSKVCPHHTSFVATETAYVCTNPVHEGKDVLANIPGGNQTGGCPTHYVVAKKFAVGKTPTEQCTIKEHQVSGDAGGAGNAGSSIPAVVDLSASVSGNTANISWDYYGSVEPIFQVKYTDRDSSNQIETRSYQAAITNLSSGKTYIIQVRAVDAADPAHSGSWSESITVSIP